ncbi:PAS domain S-box protein [Chitinophaga horti]|uniref:histidine kinase n=1 Tax=Chitinophaga horti TaxID=2920382 RepID=A0ABY6J4E2_9BACT|nr:PAS domain S-box protein [Chitinophaga horti]UYQ94535.1 PAS domain S-box protein [Chitinophaga horti]
MDTYSLDFIKTLISNERHSGASAGMYIKLLHSLPLAVFACDRDGFLQMYNNAAVTLWGREPKIGEEKWCGSFKIFHTDGRPMPFEESPLGIAMRGGKVMQGSELLIERPDGSRRVVTTNPMPIFDDNDELVGGVNILIDVTDQKQAAQKAFHLAAIVTSSEDAIASKTLEGIVTSWNESAERMFGWAASEIIGKSILTLVPQDRHMEEPLILQRIRNGERLSYFETKRLTKSGQLIDVSLTISPIKNERGEVIGASKIVRNITEEKKVQRKLQEEEERFRMAVAATKLGTWDYYVPANEFSLSHESLAICGIEETDNIYLELLLDHVSTEDVNALVTAASESFKPNSNGHFDIPFRFFRLNDNGQRWLRMQGTVFFDQLGHAESVVGTLLDITEEMQARETLEELVRERTAELQLINEQLQRSNRELEQFAYITSHDLQEPLRKIQTFSDLISDCPDDKQLRDKFLPKINKAAAHMSELIRQVLNFSRLSNDLQLPASVDLNLVVREVFAEFDLLVEEKHAYLRCAELPVIRGIHHQLVQLFRNLVGNSLKFCTTAPKIAIDYDVVNKADLPVEAPAGNPAKTFARIVLRDNGIGFEQQYADKIFLIFKRLNNKDQYAGTGVGLALCKKIVENHGGLIMAESKHGEGAAFNIYLPL